MALAKRFISCSFRSHTNSLLFFSRRFSAKLFVKGVAFSTTDETLAEAFSEFGQVLEAKIIMDKVRNRSKGFGYVTFSSEDEAQKALEKTNGMLLHGRVIFVDSARLSNHFESFRVIARGPPESTE